MATLPAMDSGGANNSAVHIIPKCQYESNGYCCLDKKLFKSYCVYCIQGNVVDRDANCNGRGWRDDDVSYTLNTIDRPAVYDVKNFNNLVDASPPLTESMYKGPHAVYDARRNGNGEIAPTITGDHQNRVTDYTAICIGNGQADSLRLSEMVGALNCMHDQQAVIIHSTVRRLTPIECERLQGYPDEWFDIGEWTDSKGKKHQTTDSARYKALGNSIALPPWRFVCRRICEQYDTPTTMGSLFDGIGGFPLIWHEINGADSVPWACEIDEYCKAVTRRRLS